MRGTFLSPFDSKYGTELLNLKNPHFFLEKLVMPEDSDISIHLLLPTQFGLYLNEIRFKKVAELWSEAVEMDAEMNLNVLIQQDIFTCQCVKCSKELVRFSSNFFVSNKKLDS